MAERLPGLTDPNAPAPTPAQPGQPATAPATPPAPKLLPSAILTASRQEQYRRTPATNPDRTS